MDLEIRRAEPTTRDLAWVASLFHDYRQHFGAAPDGEGSRRYIEERLRHGESIVFLALHHQPEGPQPAGFVQLYPSFSSLAISRIWVLNDLWVVPGGRGRGVGRALMEAARAHAVTTGATRIILETYESNRAAQRLYQSLGYRCENDEVKFYALELGAPAA
jgi:ribosomal protein S18 acetylase RimI-like enzyme